MFAMLVLQALSSIFVPLFGQNIGARKSDRVREIIRKSEIFSLLYSLMVVIILVIFSGTLGRIFTDNKAVIQTVKVYMYRWY